MDYFVHPSAIVDQGAVVGSGTTIWHWTHVCAGAAIGESCSLGQNVFVADSVRIGNRVKIQNNVSVYAGVVLSDDVFCGPSMVFTNVYNPRAAIPRKDQYLETRVERGVTLGANCTVVCGVTIGEYAFVAAGAVVKSDVKPYALIVGVPGKQKGWMSRFGERIDLPVEGHGEAICPHTGERYRLVGNQLQLIGDL